MHLLFQSDQSQVEIHLHAVTEAISPSEVSYVQTEYVVAVTRDAILNGKGDVPVDVSANLDASVLFLQIFIVPNH
jgi:hypothetical protein